MNAQKQGYFTQVSPIAVWFYQFFLYYRNIYLTILFEIYFFILFHASSIVINIQPFLFLLSSFSYCCLLTRGVYCFPFTILAISLALPFDVVK